jgi:hypothetical protein
MPASLSSLSIGLAVGLRIPVRGPRDHRVELGRYSDRGRQAESFGELVAVGPFGEGTPATNATRGTPESVAPRQSRHGVPFARANSSVGSIVIFIGDPFVIYDPTIFREARSREKCRPKASEVPTLSRAPPPRAAVWAEA